VRCGSGLELLLHPAAPCAAAKTDCRTTRLWRFVRKDDLLTCTFIYFAASVPYVIASLPEAENPPTL